MIGPDRGLLKKTKNLIDKLNLNDPSLIKPGDKVSFYKISKQEYLNFNE